ncbi:MAG TPA: HD domain-containing phosphohydrolase [Acidimicrobiales bacterium]|nr:HD domain-containing phosphohydrolase [Acidimicrobiales bacterium]
MGLDLLPGREFENRQESHDDVVELVDHRLIGQEQRFWASYFRLGYVMFTGGSLFVLAYFVATPNGSHRPALLAISSLSLTVAVGTLLFVDKVSTYPWRVTFSLFSTLFAGAALSLCIYLDGGLASPLIILLALPVMSAALALPVEDVLICGIGAFVEVGVVTMTDSHLAKSASDLVVLCAFLIGTVALSMGAAAFRSRLQADGERLVLELARLAHTDSLTGCLSHGAFYERLNVEINRALRHSEPLSLLVADIDLFKSFNDSRGHAEGDAALAVTGSIMRNASRSIDTVARIGGDEFAVILPTTDLASASKLARRMTTALNHSEESEISVSIGFAALDPLEPTSQKLFRDADLGLYRAKADGRECAATVSDVPTGAPSYVRHVQGVADLALEQADWERIEESLRESNHATAVASSIIDSLQSTASVGFGYVDREFRFLRINPMLASVHGGRVEDQIGRTVAEAIPALWPTLKPIYQHVLDTGEAVINQEVSGETAVEPTRVHYWLTNLNPVRVNGIVTGIGIVVIDITDRKELEESQATLTRSVVGALSASIELRDPYTAGHQERVAQIAVAVATELRLEPDEVDAIELAARIHDLGKLSVPSEILTRPGRLNDAEMEVVRIHSQAGFDLLERVNFPEHVGEMILQHHERLDGSGYPNGLQGEQIALGSRIIAVADVVESMASPRPYRPALGLDAALKEIQRGSGTLFDADVVEACMNIVKSGKVSFDQSGLLLSAPRQHGLGVPPIG